MEDEVMQIEYEVGLTFHHDDGKSYEVKKSEPKKQPCVGCAFYTPKPTTAENPFFVCPAPTLKCSRLDREDCTDVYFEEVKEIY